MMMTTTERSRIEVEAVNDLARQLPSLLQRQEDELREVQERMHALKAAGLIYAAEHWRNKKYFYLIYPQVGGQRKRQYVGTDPDRIAEARAGIQRGKDYDLLKENVAAIESRITAAKFHINSAQFELRSALSQLRPDGDTYPKAWRNECHHLHGDSHRPAPAAIAPESVTML
jgi:hypothetical protein